MRGTVGESFGFRPGGFRPGHVLAAGVALLLLGAPLHAGDGKLEINQDCAVTGGCFPGDSGGFPVTINSPGSYILTSGLSVGAALDGIAIQTDGVTLDLNGFGLTAPSGGQGITGIELGGDFIEVRNGRVSGFGEGVKASNPPSNGLSSRVVNVTITPGINGILVSDHSMVLDSTVIGGTGIGITSGDFSTVAGNIVRDAGDTIQDGIRAGSEAVVRDNVVWNAAGSGIRVDENSLVAGNNSSENGESGIVLAGFGHLATGNVANFNQEHGILGVANAFIHANTAIGNNQSAMGFANITCPASCTLLDNHAP